MLDRHVHQGQLKFRQRPTLSTEIEHTGPETHHVRSGVLPVIRDILNQENASVFDLGPPTSKKHNYLCGSGARVYWDNTPGSFSNTFHGTGADQMSTLLKKWTPPRLDGPLGLILAWSYFDYLKLEDLKVWFNKLNEFVAIGSRIYFLIHHSVYIPDSAPLFDLEINDMLQYSTASVGTAASRHPPKQLEQMMPGFEIEKLFLMSNGLQEHLFYKKH